MKEETKERYSKDCIRQYEDGWYITFKPLRGIRKKSHGPYKTNAIADNDREVLNGKLIKHKTEQPEPTQSDWKGTKGVWYRDGTHIVVDQTNDLERNETICVIHGDGVYLSVHDRSGKEAVVNADMIIEASEVRQQIDCSLTELLAQRDELLKDKERLLRALHDLILGWYDGDLKNKAFESAKAEIKALKG